MKTSAKTIVTLLSKIFFSIVLTTTLIRPSTAPAMAKHRDGLNIEGLIGKFPFELEKIINRIIEIKKSIVSGTTLPKGNNRYLLYGDPGNGKRSIVKFLAEKNNVELIDIQGGILRACPPEESLNILKQTYSDIQAIMDRDNIVIVMIDELSLINRNQQINTLFWEILNFLKKDSRCIIIGIENLTIIDPLLLNRFNGLNIKISNPDLCTQKDILEYSWQQAFGTPTTKERTFIQQISAIVYRHNLSAQALNDLIEESANLARKLGLRIPNEKTIREALSKIEKKDYRSSEARHKTRKVIKKALKEYGPMLLKEVGKTTFTFLLSFLTENDDSVQTNKQQ